MNAKIIGLCGRAGSGKSSVGKYIREKYGAESLSFAAPLKKMAMDIWGFSPEQVYGEADVKETVDPRWGITPREAMQKLGQAARDHLGSEIWVDHLFRRLRKGQIYVIEDIRHENEVEAVYHSYEKGDVSEGYVFRLHCADSISKDGGQHESETSVDRIPLGYISAEIYSSRAQGLPHLFGLVDGFLNKILR